MYVFPYHFSGELSEMINDLLQALELQVLVVTLLLRAHGATDVALHLITLVVQELVNIWCTREQEEHQAVHNVAEKHFLVVFAVLVLDFPDGLEAACPRWLVSPELGDGARDEVIAWTCRHPLLLCSGDSVSIHMHYKLVDEYLPLKLIGDVNQLCTKMEAAKVPELLVHKFFRLVVSKHIIYKVLLLEFGIAIDVVL